MERLAYEIKELSKVGRVSIHSVELMKPRAPNGTFDYGHSDQAWIFSGSLGRESDALP